MKRTRKKFHSETEKQHGHNKLPGAGRNLQDHYVNIVKK